jgi:MFS family permease
LIAGGLLTSYLSWRWVLLVNVPIGVLTAAAAPFALAESARRRDRFDLPGAVTGTGGVALLVYGLSNAATGQSGAPHWADPKVVTSLTAAAVLLAGFVITEARSAHALMPLRIFANRNRSGAYLITLLIGTALFGLFFFLIIFVQDVLGYSALKTGIAFLPLAVTIVVISAIIGQVIARTGARPLMLAGAAITAGGMYWFSQISVHTTYASGLLGPMLVTAAGLGLLFVPHGTSNRTLRSRPNCSSAARPWNTTWATSGPGAFASLHRDEFDVDARSVGQPPQVAGVGGEDVIAVPGQAHHRGVDRIGQVAAGQ